jgi:hypothetical protein
MDRPFVLSRIWSSAFKKASLKLHLNKDGLLWKSTEGMDVYLDEILYEVDLFFIFNAMTIIIALCNYRHKTVFISF